MKKVLVIICFIFGVNQTVVAQLDFGLKAGVNYNTESIKNLEDTEKEFLNEAEGKLGYHVGVWLRGKIPVIGMYIRPELVYTVLKSEATSSENTTLKVNYDFQKIDIPVLIGKKFAKIAFVHIGPSFQYIIDSNLKVSKGVLDTAIKETEADGLSVGLQLGGGIELGAFGVDIRWERGFNDVESKLIPKEAGKTTLNFDTRVNQIIFGISYKF